MPVPMKAPTNAAHLISSLSTPRQMAATVKTKQTARDTRPGELGEPKSGRVEAINVPDRPRL